MVVDPYELIVEDTPDPEHVRQIVAGLVAYNTSQAGSSHHKPLGVFLRVHGQIVGGADGYTHWRWLYVSHLWVDDTVRQKGAGRQIMAMMEDAARDRGCRAAWLDTHSFQALGFYQALGYQLFGELSDYPHGHSRHFLWKSLDDGAVVDPARLSNVCLPAGDYPCRFAACASGLAFGLALAVRPAGLVEAPEGPARTMRSVPRPWAVTLSGPGASARA